MARREVEPLTHSMIGCSAAALVNRAPEVDPPEEPVEGYVKPAYDRSTRISRPPAKMPEDEKGLAQMCRRCGLVPSPYVGKHRSAADCIDALRTEIAILNFHPGPPKRRAVAAR